MKQFDENKKIFCCNHCSHATLFISGEKYFDELSGKEKNKIMLFCKIVSYEKTQDNTIRHELFSDEKFPDWCPLPDAKED